jgi:hypothetical protein
MEHIHLDSGAVEEPERTGDSRTVIHREITQMSKINGHQARLRICNERSLNILNRKFGSSTNGYSVDLRYLDPKPQRELRISWGWLGLAAAFLGTAIILGATIDAALPYALGALAAGTISLAVAMYRSGQRLVWVSRYGRIGLVELMLDQPSRAEVRAFANDLKERIARAHKAQRIDRAQLLSRELREHRRLKDEGVLTEALYAKAKGRILASHQ